MAYELASDTYYGLGVVTASLATASTAGAWHTLMTLGELLRLNGDAGRDGVVFLGAGFCSLGASCLATYRSTSMG